MASLAQLLNDHNFLKLQTNNKILCELTDHEMSARADVVQAYINGKKFKKESEWYRHDFSEFLPYIVDDKDNVRQLYCKITKQTLNKIPQQVRKHMQGKRFQRLLEEYKEKEQKKESKKKVHVNEEEDNDDEWDPVHIADLIEGDNDEEVDVPVAKRRMQKDEDNMSDLLGSSSEEEDEDEESAMEEAEVKTIKKTVKKPKKEVKTTGKTAAKSSAKKAPSTTSSNGKKKATVAVKAAKKTK